jgi:glycosyltransferase involved in cell wall biosynthesis
MKLLIIHNKYPSNNIGGEEIVYKNELESLKERLGSENVYGYEVPTDNINKVKLIFTIWFSKKYYNEVKKILEKNSIDLVHVHNFYPLLTPSIFKAGKDGGAKVVHTLHNYRLWCISGMFYRDKIGICELCTKSKFSLQAIFNKCFRKSIIQSMLAQFTFWYYRFTKIFDNIDYFFVLTNFQKEKVKSLGIKKERIILKPNSLKMNFNINKDRKDYIYVGRLQESKGIYELLKVWDTLEDKYILTVIGGGDQEVEIKERYNKNNIIFKGKCSREETLKYISKSKYLIQPSLLYETFGLTIIEAMSFGVPVIGFNIGTRGDFIKDEENGFLSNDSDLGEVIKKSFEYKEYEYLSKNAIKKARLYENDYVIDNQVKIYKNILENKI